MKHCNDSGRSAARLNSWWFRSWVFIVLGCLISLSFLEDAEGRRRRRRKSRAPVINEKKLYERMGGVSALNKVAADWHQRNMDDSRISGIIRELGSKPDFLGRLQTGLGTHLCELADGPCRPNISDVTLVYRKLSKDEKTVLIFAENLFLSMQNLKVSEREINELLGRIGAFQAELSGTSGGAS